MSNNNDYVRDFIDAIDAGDNVKAQSDFDSEMSTRISSALDNKRQEVAKTFIRKNQNEDA
jgi:hypothetical protein